MCRMSLNRFRISIVQHNFFQCNAFSVSDVLYKENIYLLLFLYFFCIICLTEWNRVYLIVYLLNFYDDSMKPNTENII